VYCNILVPEEEKVWPGILKAIGAEERNGAGLRVNSASERASVLILVTDSAGRSVAGGICQRRGSL